MSATTSTASKTKARTKSAKTTTSTNQAQTVGVATASDVALAASLAATPRTVDAGVSDSIVNLFRDPALVASLQTNAAAIDDQGKGTTSDILSRIPNFVARYDALQRLEVSVARVRQSLTQDNADFSQFATAATSVYKNAGALSSIKKDKALKALAQNRSVQRGLPKMVKTRKKKARAKKSASSKLN